MSMLSLSPDLCPLPTYSHSSMTLISSDEDEIIFIRGNQCCWLVGFDRQKKINWEGEVTQSETVNFVIFDDCFKTTKGTLSFFNL